MHVTYLGNKMQQRKYHNRRSIQTYMNRRKY